MDAKVVWKGQLNFDGSADSGIVIPVGVHGEGVSPMEMLAIGLVGCTAMDVISILEKKHQEVSGFEVRVHAERANDHPRIFTTMMVEYVVTGHEIDRQAVERAVELSATKYCSAEAMLSKAAKIENTITLVNV